MNPVEVFQRQGDEVKLFKEILERQGIPASIRKEQGQILKQLAANSAKYTR